MGKKISTFARQFHIKNLIVIVKPEFYLKSFDFTFSPYNFVLPTNK
jgi:hypothetical protein